MDIKQNILDKVNEWLTPTFDERNTRSYQRNDDFISERIRRKFL
jgi:hypothetical protein